MARGHVVVVAAIPLISAVDVLKSQQLWRNLILSRRQEGRRRSVEVMYQSSSRRTSIPSRKQVDQYSMVSQPRPTSAKLVWLARLDLQCADNGHDGWGNGAQRISTWEIALQGEQHSVYVSQPSAQLLLISLVPNVNLGLGQVS